MRLRKTLLIAAALALFAAPTFALEGWAFVAPGGVSSGVTHGTLHVGGGGEHVFGRGIGVGAEIGALGPWANFRGAIGVLSVNGSYHFAHGAKLDPFVTGGYSLGFRSGTLNLGNYGAGVNYWMRDRFGLRAEFRDHLHVNRGPNVHFWGLRLGVTLR